MNDRQRFESAQRRYREAEERRETFRRAMLAKYGRLDPPRAWMTRGEIDRLERIRRAEDRAGDALFAVLDRVSPRGWRSGPPFAWVMTELSWEDAATSGALSAVPPCGYGARPRDMERFAAPLAGGGMTYKPTNERIAG